MKKGLGKKLRLSHPLFSLGIQRNHQQVKSPKLFKPFPKLFKPLKMLRRSPRIAANVTREMEDQERYFWTRHITSRIHTHGTHVSSERAEFIKTTKQYLKIIDVSNTNKQVDKIGELYEYLLTIPLMLHLYPRFKDVSLQKIIDLTPKILGRDNITKETKDNALHAFHKFQTMCKYLDCLSWYNSTVAEPTKATLRHYADLFSKHKHEPFYNTIYDPITMKVVKAVFRDGPHILEVPPQGLKFGKVEITYNCHEICVTYNGVFHLYT